VDGGFEKVHNSVDDDLESRAYEVFEPSSHCPYYRLHTKFWEIAFPFGRV
jgi:hypothetical protein